MMMAPHHKPNEGRGIFPIKVHHHSKTNWKEMTWTQLDFKGHKTNKKVFLELITKTSKYGQTKNATQISQI
jgi:hypothetical protein